MNKFEAIFFKVLLLQIVFLFSCAYIPKTLEQPDVKLNNAGVQKIERCKKIYGRFGLIEHLPFEPKYLKHSEIEDNAVLENAELKIRNLIKDSGILDFSSKSDFAKSLIFGYTIYRDTHNYGLLWLPALTLGIIPAKVTTDYSLGVRVFNANGSLLKEYKSSVVAFDYYVGLWFVPLAYRDDSLNLREIENKYLPVLYYDVLEKMSSDGVISCKP